MKFQNKKRTLFSLTLGSLQLALVHWGCGLSLLISQQPGTSARRGWGYIIFLCFTVGLQQLEANRPHLLEAPPPSFQAFSLLVLRTVQSQTTAGGLWGQLWFEGQMSSIGLSV